MVLHYVHTGKYGDLAKDTHSLESTRNVLVYCSLLLDKALKSTWNIIKIDKEIVIIGLVTIFCLTVLIILVVQRAKFHIKHSRCY